LQTTVSIDGDSLVVNGRKWFITGAAHPACRLLIVMCRCEDGDLADRHASHSMVLVPVDTPGVEIVRNISILQHHAPDGHCEIVFRNVRVPAANLLGRHGAGFAMAQARLGPGRIHHCMRTIGQCELALALMCERTLERHAFGKYLSDFSNVQEWIAESRLEIDQARLLVLRSAWLLDQGDAARARVDVSAIKVVAARLQTRGVNRAMQLFGAMGLSPDTPLAY
jgi:acyl-CoA dehydrogenase